jgi:hypothetical protein
LIEYAAVLVLESANMVSYWDRTIITDKTVDLNRHNIMLTENKTVLVINITFPLNNNLPKTGAEKFTEYENLALEIKTIWKLKHASIYPLVISAGVVTKNS